MYFPFFINSLIPQVPYYALIQIHFSLKPNKVNSESEIENDIYSQQFFDYLFIFISVPHRTLIIKK